MPHDFDGPCHQQYVQALYSMQSICRVWPRPLPPSNADLNVDWTVQVVAVQGRHLQTADLSVVSLSELAVYNIRRLFANRQSEFMALQQASDDQKPRLRRIRNATME